MLQPSKNRKRHLPQRCPLPTTFTTCTMATPSKFDMGDMPRTKTGLVPTSYRQKIEELSIPWSPLPTKPKPPMYPFRGDYVNERNRKLLLKRKLALEQKQHLNENSKTINDSLGDILTVTPYSSIHANAQISGKKSTNTHPDPISPAVKQWNTYSKHVSFHKLSVDEERAKARNKSKFVLYLRSEASRRHDNKGKQTKYTNEQLLDCPEVVVRPRKPPVPRLSYLARSKQLRENSADGQQPPRPSKAKSLYTRQECEQKDNKQASAKSTTIKAGYLDFISKETNHPHLAAEFDASFTAKLNPRKNDDEDFGSTSHSQIQRIVERAAEIVLSERVKYATNLKDEIAQDTVNTTSDCQEYSSDDFKDFDFVALQRNLTILEKQISSICPSVVSESSLSLTSNDIVHLTDVFHLRREITIPGETKVGNACNSKLETRTRTHIRPICGKSMNDLMHSIDLSSCTTSFLTDVESSASPRSYGQVRTDRPIIDENSTSTTSTSTTSWNGTEMISRIQGQPTYALDHFYPHDNECPLEAMPLRVYQSIKPSTELHCEDEPLPRGYENSVSPLSNRNVVMDGMVFLGTDYESCRRNEKQNRLLMTSFHSYLNNFFRLQRGNIILALNQVPTLISLK